MNHTIKSAISTKFIVKLYLFISFLLLSNNTIAQTDSTNTIATDTAIEESIVIGNTNKKDEITIKTKQLISVAGAALDPIQAIFTLPGVTENNEGEPVLRGSASADNNYYIDLIPVFNLFHIFGNSIVDKKVLRDFKLYPSAFPSRYSNSTAGVIDIELREPKSQPLKLTLDASFLIAGIFVESQLGKNDAFFFNYRRSFLDLAADALLDDNTEPEDGIRVQKFPISTDYTGKYSYDAAGAHSFNFIMSGSRDSIGIEFLENSEPVLRDTDLEGPIAVSIGYDSQGLKWDYDPDQYGLSINQLLVNYQSKIRQTYGNAGQRTVVDENKLLYRFDLIKDVASYQKVAVGYSIEQDSTELDITAKFSPCSEFNPDERCYDSELPLININRALNKINSSNFYIESHYDVAKYTQLAIGINYFDTSLTNSSRSELRLSLLSQLADSLEVEFKFGEYSQLPDLIQLDPLVGNPNLNNPTAKHYNLKVTKQFNELWQLSLEYYYKDLDQIVTSVSEVGDKDELFEAVLPYNNDSDGISKGVEIFIKRELGNNWFGWLAASYNSAKRRLKTTNQVVPFQFERPITYDFVLNYQPNVNKAKRWEYSLAFNYQSGARYTPVVAVDYKKDGDETADCNSIESCIDADGVYFEPIYGELNSYRVPASTRLDLRFEYISTKNNGKEFRLYFDIYNATNRMNTLSYEFSPKDGKIGIAEGFGDDIPVEAEVSFGIIPSIGVQFDL